MTALHGGRTRSRSLEAWRHSHLADLPEEAREAMLADAFVVTVPARARFSDSPRRLPAALPGWVTRLPSARSRSSAPGRCAGSARLTGAWRGRSPSRWRVTPAKQRVLQHLPTRTNAEIADTLYISQNTVKTHLRSIY
jgi:hypothetical protein